MENGKFLLWQASLRADRIMDHYYDLNGRVKESLKKGVYIIRNGNGRHYEAHEEVASIAKKESKTVHLRLLLLSLMRETNRITKKLLTFAP